MFLNNYFKWKTLVETEMLENSNNYNYKDINNGIKNVGGSTIYVGCDMHSNFYANQMFKLRDNIRLDTSWKIKLGSGSTDYTGDEYNLPTDSTTAFSNLTYTWTENQDNGELEKVLTISGTATENTTINQIGYVKTLYCGNGPNMNLDYQEDVLMSIIPLGQTYTFSSGQTFVLTLNWNEFNE